ncbi:RNA-binding S4 domain-containing protein [Fusibacter sp. 3D3]|uniref:RNA-binding S4 domain-containing protein n=1 Tax=Fusibacter sp. 3D3 TaxID=1048380 RepID=UPI000853ADB5|nr:RNA-binding S4 domain-containing protein [Fusibacter sp. 3D3]GAU76107.1 rRibosome-associated heat shock protein implicated in the recycling of the 50S subunit [Fusibacter sp. 3D3]
MRIDKYLKNARLIKRRTIAKEACDQGRVSVNGKIIKASAEVAVGDEVIITFGNRKINFRITALEEHVKKELAKELYEILSEEKIENL